MKVKFSKVERVAGLFIVVALTGAIAITVIAAIKKGWFETKIDFKTRVLSADGLRPGAPVTISGIRAGEISDIELLSADNIIVHFSLFEKFHKQVHTDSKVYISRPFIIGDKAMEVTVGSHNEPIVRPGDFIESEVAFDMLDIVSGKKLGPFLGTIEGLMKNLSILIKAFADPKRMQSFIKVFDRMDPLVENFNKMSLEVTKFSVEFNRFLPQFNKESPEIGREFSQLIKQLNSLTANLAPAFKEIGPELPKASHRALEALDQMVITLKAMQKSFLLSGNVKEVKEEEGEQQRKPAGK
ncbi:MAG: hypothetical protein A2Z20_06230 [Bdellovibrionales bacterium RBG_16_40_8]|nr:MAG: hypothetical protein A2Z20_06230 [Bdellovibrionales bacterium RBG_16_40_8]